MPKHEPIKSYLFYGRSGCLLPLLIIFNLLWGWIFLKPRYWLLLEAILILLFIINTYIIARKIRSFSAKNNDVIDVEGKVIEDKEQLN